MRLKVSYLSRQFCPLALRRAAGGAGRANTHRLPPTALSRTTSPPARAARHGCSAVLLAPPHPPVTP